MRGTVYCECLDTEITHRQDRNVRKRDALLRWLESNPGWQTITDAAKGTGMAVMKAGLLVNSNPRYFRRIYKDSNSTTTYYIRRVESLEVQPWNG
jgi:hypothetical protein